jgi:hypothetical protein
MKYKLADGSMSTDYNIGDEFVFYYDSKRVFIFKDDDDSDCPWFQEKGNCFQYARRWLELKPIKAMKHANTINQLRETIKQLEATIKELEQ